MTFTLVVLLYARARRGARRHAAGDGAALARRRRGRLRGAVRPVRARRCWPRARSEQRRRRRRGAVGRRDGVRRVRRRGLRRRLLEPGRRRRRARPARARADRLGDRPGLGGQPRLADLRARRALDRVLGGVRVDLLDAVHPAQPGRARASCCAARASPSTRRRGGSGAGRSPSGSSGSRRCSRRSSWAPSSAPSPSGRVPVGNAAGDPVTSWLNPLSLVIGALFVATSAYLAAVFLVSDARRAGAPDLERYFTTRALGGRRRRGRARRRRHRRAARRRALRLRRPHRRRAAARDRVGAVRRRRARPAPPRRAPRAPGRSRSAPSSPSSGAGASRSTRTCCRRCSRSTPAPRRAPRSPRVLIVFGVAVVLVIPSIALLYTLAQRSLVEEGESPQPHRAEADPA